jgi:hypothetical protein
MVNPGDIACRYISIRDHSILAAAVAPMTGGLWGDYGAVAVRTLFCVPTRVA